MDKFPKIETIEATFFGLLIDKDTPLVVGKTSERLRGQSPSFRRILQAALATVAEAATEGHPEVGMSVCLALAFQAGVQAEKVRAECEQLQDAMNPRQLTEGRQEPHDCDTIT